MFPLSWVFPFSGHWSLFTDPKKSQIRCCQLCPCNLCKMWAWWQEKSKHRKIKIHAEKNRSFPGQHCDCKKKIRSLDRAAKESNRIQCLSGSINTLSLRMNSQKWEGKKITKTCLIDISVTKVRTQYHLFYFQKLVPWWKHSAEFHWWITGEALARSSLSLCWGIPPLPGCFYPFSTHR